MFKMFKRVNKKDIPLVIIGIIFIVAQVYLDLKMPDYMANITTLLQTNVKEINAILKEGTFMLACALGSLISAIIVGYCTASLGTSFGSSLRKAIFDKVISFNMEEIKAFSVSSLITRNTNDVTQVQMFIVMGLQMIIKAPIMAIWAISKIANKGFEFTMIASIGVAIVLTVIITLVLLVLPKFKLIQKLTDNLNRITRENLTGIRVVRAYNALDYQNKRFALANDSLTNTNLFVQKAMAIMAPLMTLVMSGISLAIYWVGSYLINEAIAFEKISIFGNMVVFAAYAIQVIMAFMMLVFVFILYPRSSVSAKRINEVLDTDITIKNGEINTDTTSLKGVVEFKNVSFKYPDAEEYILKNISFKALQGQTVAFIGSTGSGKSTLINLIPRFYNANDGEVLVNGVNVKDMDEEYLHSKIGYVPQKAVMFKKSVKDNIAFGQQMGKKVELKSIKKAVEIAQGKEFVESLENGYDSQISQGATNVSGGQKQRLSIARAIARNPEIYIFDDTFSALDYKTDFNLRSSLKKHTSASTILIVAQRIGTIMDADLIIVLDEGECVGMGSHKELLENCKVYKEIAASQLSKEELANA